MRRKSGAGKSRLAKAYPDMATSGTVGARSWKIRIELEAAHVRHENIDDHHVEARIFQRAKPGLAAPSDRDRKSVAFEIQLDRHADHGIVVVDENACHVSPRDQARAWNCLIAFQSQHGPARRRSIV